MSGLGAKLMSMSPLASLAIGVGLGYLCHPVIKLGLNALRLLLKLI